MAQHMSLPGTTHGQHRFSEIPRADIPRSTFDRNNGWKGTFDGGYLVPMFWDEVLPGDTMNLKMTAFTRLATPLTPFMDNLYMDTFFFFVPLRLLWTNFQKFMGEQTNPGDSTDYLTPKLVSPVNGWAVGSLQDNMGYPTSPLPDPSRTITLTAFNTRAYNLIFNTWFRDQNLQPSVKVDLGDGPDNSADYVMLRRGKRPDYFTSALPWPQKGPSVTLPLGQSAPVVGIGAVGNVANFQTISSSIVRESNGSNVPYPNALPLRDGSTNNTLYANMSSSVAASARPQIFADLTQATAATINQLRQAFQIQKLYERDARGGTRYTEIIQSHFGVISDDARLQRPEYLGGGTTPININPIAQTSTVPSQQTPQGTLTAIGTASIHGHGFTKSFLEHGIIIGLINVRADLNYQQGLDRGLSRNTRFDYYWPALSHIGEQAILNKEIYAGTSSDDLAFGYQERFAEYRYKPSKITGQFRSTYSQPLDMWHLAEKFTSLPLLNSTFIQSNPPISRVVAVTSQPQFLCDAWFTYKSARAMPTYSVPGLIDHF